MQYNDGVPEGTRFATHSKFFKGTVDSLQKEEGLTKIRKINELTVLAEQGESIEKIMIACPSPYLGERIELGCSVTHLALAWVAKNPNTSTVILGATKPEQVLDNLKALEVIPKLTPEILDKIEIILDNRPASPVCKFWRLGSKPA